MLSEQNSTVFSPIASTALTITLTTISSTVSSTSTTTTTNSTKISYGSFCSSSSQCDETAGLTCPTSTGTCNCPLNSTKIFCDCTFGEYYDNTTNMCSMRHFSFLKHFLIYFISSILEKWKYDL